MLIPMTWDSVTEVAGWYVNSPDPANPGTQFGPEVRTTPSPGSPTLSFNVSKKDAKSSGGWG